MSLLNFLNTKLVCENMIVIIYFFFVYFNGNITYLGLGTKTTTEAEMAGEERDGRKRWKMT